MPRCVYLLGVGLALVALALAFTDWALSLQPGVTEANARHVRLGMTLAEVESLLGGPGVDLGDWMGMLRSWRGEEGLALVTYDPQTMTAASAEFRPSPDHRPSLFASLRAWLGR